MPRNNTFDFAFDFPEQARVLTEKNVQQASAAYGQFLDAMTQTMGMWWTALPANEMTSDFKAVQEQAVRFAKQNSVAAFQFATSLANARNVQDVLGLQTHYAQTQMRTYALQAQELGKLLVEALQKRR